MNKKIRELLTIKVSPMAMFIGCLIVCLIIAGAVVKANNDSITVQNGGTLNITNQSGGDSLGDYREANQVTTFTDVNVDNDLVVDGLFTSTGAAALSSTLNVSGESQLSRTIVGGTVLASTSLYADTLTAANICDNSVLSWTLPHGVINVTLPASSTLIADCLDTVGDSVSFLFRNRSTAAATTTTIVAGADEDLQSDDANGDVIAGLDTAKITITRGSAGSDLVVIVDPYTPAD